MLHVFKTSVKTKKEVKKIKPGLDNQIFITHWNFDLEDCDNILRIESRKTLSKEIINLLDSHNFQCEELM